VRLHGGTRALDGSLEPGLFGVGELAEVRNDQFVDEAQHARVLLDRSLGVDRRDLLGHQVRTRLLEEPRQLLESRRERPKAVGQRR
jgi:hypothetical protein